MAGFTRGFTDGWNSTYTGYRMAPRKQVMSRLFILILGIALLIGIFGGIDLVQRLWPAWFAAAVLWCLGCAWAEHTETPKGHLPMADALRDDVQHP